MTKLEIAMLYKVSQELIAQYQSDIERATHTIKTLEREIEGKKKRIEAAKQHLSELERMYEDAKD